MDAPVGAVSSGPPPWSQLPACVLGSLVGGLAAVFSDDLIARPREHAPAGDVVGDRPQPSS